MKHDNHNVALQAVEFWSTICEVELDIEEENEYSASDGTPPRVNYKFAANALKEIIPVLLWLLTKKDEDEDEDDWNISMAAATCIQLLASVCRDDIVGQVVQFVEANIKHQDWRFRDAAVMAFGSIMDGPSEKYLGIFKEYYLCIRATINVCFEDPLRDDFRSSSFCPRYRFMDFGQAVREVIRLNI